MSLVADHALGTVVRNNSGGTRFFGYLGRRGKNLAANEQYTHPGDLSQWLVTQRLGRLRKNFKADLAAGILIIESTPAVILYDFANSHPRQLELNSNVLGFSAPLEGQSPNSAFTGA